MVSSTLGLYSAFLAWSAIVLRSKRQARLIVETMFLESKPLSLMLRIWQQGSYSLQGWHDPTHTLSSTWRRRRSSGCHPIAVGGIPCLKLLPLGVGVHATRLSVCLGLSIFFRRGRQLSGSSWERQRRRRDERICLDGVGRVRGDSTIHFCRSRY